MYRVAHREEINAARRLQRPPGGTLAYRKYRTEHRKEIAASNHRFHVDRREQIRVRKRKWYAAAPEARREVGRRYRATHLDAERARKRNVEHLRRQRVQASDLLLTAADEQRLLAGRTMCPLCSKKMRDDVGPNDPRSKQLDHIVPVTVGGVHTEGNVRVICRLCNLGRPKDGSDYRGQMDLLARSG
jgi:hypothetical protein